MINVREIFKQQQEKWDVKQQMLIQYYSYFLSVYVKMASIAKMENPFDEIRRKVIKCCTYYIIHAWNCKRDEESQRNIHIIIIFRKKILQRKISFVCFITFIKWAHAFQNAHTTFVCSLLSLHSIPWGLVSNVQIDIIIGQLLVSSHIFFFFPFSLYSSIRRNLFSVCTTYVVRMQIISWTRKSF